MDVILYKNNSPNNFITKWIADTTPLTGSLREGSSIIDPVILIEFNNPTRFNYMYIDDFARYYYINNIECVRNSLWRLSCHVDVLMTYRSQILDHQCIISKQASTGNSNLMIDDGEWVVENRKFNRVIHFPNGLNDDGEYILITAGS